MVDLLVCVAVLGNLHAAPGQGDDRRAGQVGVLKPCRQIGCADRLGHADAHAPADPGIAVGHIGCCFLSVRQDPLDPQPLHFQ